MAGPQLRGAIGEAIVGPKSEDAGCAAVTQQCRFAQINTDQLKRVMFSPNFPDREACDVQQETLRIVVNFGDATVALDDVPQCGLGIDWSGWMQPRVCPPVSSFVEPLLQ
ncbi:unnamed protein product [Symbiodinium natans]|uniref:Uncharacterized protein n=1 Tax=Symbiodinium natans TaxID=878477 RepID=A0A812UNW7_9DINO|nr:unnamed protein product [Symbiodinium natans]